MSDQLNPQKFYVLPFFALLFLNFALFIVGIIFILNGVFSPFSSLIALLALNALGNVVAYISFKNKFMYRSLLYGQIIGFSFAGFLITICGGMFYH